MYCKGVMAGYFLSKYYIIGRKLIFTFPSQVWDLPLCFLLNKKYINLSNLRQPLPAYILSFGDATSKREVYDIFGKGTFLKLGIAQYTQEVLSGGRLDTVIFDF